MRLNPHAREEPEINLTPFIDVVLVLLIFFTVTTTFIRGTGLHINLPRVVESSSTNQAKDLEVAVDATGQYYVNGRQLRDAERRTLERALAEVAGSDRERPILIKADAVASHQSVVTVMDVAGRLGFSRVSIATVGVPK
jgi:biopolymer transport protein ExbD